MKGIREAEKGARKSLELMQKFEKWEADLRDVKKTVAHIEKDGDERENLVAQISQDCTNVLACFRDEIRARVLKVRDEYNVVLNMAVEEYLDHVKEIAKAKQPAKSKPDETVGLQMVVDKAAATILDATCRALDSTPKIRPKDAVPQEDQQAPNARRKVASRSEADPDEEFEAETDAEEDLLSESDGAEDDIAAQLTGMLQKELDEPIFAEGANRRRNTRPEPKEPESTAPTAPKAKAKKVQLSQSQKDARLPAPEPVAEEDQLDIASILKIGRDNMKADARRKGVATKSGAYKRYYAAPYAYDKRGRLARAYWPYRFMEEDGKQILTDQLRKTLCWGVQDDHEVYPWSINAKGKIYERKRPVTMESRDGQGRFRPREPAEPVVLRDVGKASLIGAAIKDSDSLLDIKKFSAEDFGKERIKQKEENLIKFGIKTAVERGKVADFAQNANKILTKQVERRAKELIKNPTDVRVVSLREEVAQLKRKLEEESERSERWKRRCIGWRAKYENFKEEVLNGGDGDEESRSEEGDEE